MTRVSRGTPAGDAYLDLQNQARRSTRTTEELLQLYILEGFLARLSASSHVSSFVLKGGVLLAAFGARRPTRDVDLAALHLNNDADSVQAHISSVLACAPLREDGIEFDLSSLQARSIRDEDEYAGVRISAQAKLASATLNFHIDINVGDPIWPAPQQVSIPRLRGGDDIALRGYPLHMVYAEKIVTALQRGTSNTRWRDFGDVWVLSRRHSVSGTALQRAFREVAQHRRCGLERLSDELAGYADTAQAKWRAWLRRSASDHLPADFSTVLEEVIRFADPAISGTVDGFEWMPSTQSWQRPRLG